MPRRTLKQLGLDRPDTRIELRCGGRTTRFNVGGSTFGAGDRYARSRSGGPVYLIAASTVRDAEGAEFRFMQRELHTFKHEDVDEARVEGRVLRFVADIGPDGCVVGPQRVVLDSPIGRLAGPDNILVFRTQRYLDNPLVIQGPDVEKLLGEILISGSRDGMIDAAHDLSDGGLIQAVVESALRGGKGARLVVPDGLDPFVLLFSESQGRAVVAVPRSEEVRFNDMCGARGLPVTRIGVVDGAEIELQGQFSIPLSELREVHEATIPALFG